ncbi:glucosyltransferase domain-containing protein [Phaeospirillum tilakii]|uniref:Glucosyltransferase domain-containing protein n=1 Tax=Phaeospirillum tilakii TaxID=741673 RepID=A0ABW5C491_9PROT
MTVRSDLVPARGGLSALWPRPTPDEGRLLLGLAALFVLFHFYQLANFALSIDDEFALLSRPASVWLGQGRFIPYLVERFLISRQVMPVVPTLLFGLGAVVGYLLLLRAWRLSGERLAALVCFPLFCAFPLWAHLLAFQSNTPSVGIGLAASGYAAWLFREMGEGPAGMPRLPGLGALLLAGAVAVGCYQSFVLVVAVGLALTILATALKAEERPAGALRRDIGRAGLTLLGILAVYLAIQRLMMVLVTAGSDDPQAPTDYILAYVQPGLLLDSPLAVIGTALGQAVAVYGGRAAAYGEAEPLFGVFSFAVAALVVAAGWRRQGGRGAVLAAAVVAVVLALPFAINLMNRGAMPTRSLFAAPVALAGLGLIGLTAAPLRLRRAGFVLAGAVLVTILVVNGRYDTNRALGQIHDQQIAAALGERLAQFVDPNRPRAGLSIYVSGGLPFVPPYPPVADTSIGASFFAWDNGNAARIVSYLRHLGYQVGGRSQIGPEEARRRDALFAQMPAWPALGAVRRLDEHTVLVKLAKPSPGGDQTASAPVEPPPFFRLSTAPRASWTVVNAVATPDPAGLLTVVAEADPQLVVRPVAPPALAACFRVVLRARLAVEKEDVVQLFYRVPGQADFSEEASVLSAIRPRADGGLSDVTLEVASPSGFVDAFRFDPVNSAQRIRLAELTLSCAAVEPR